MSATKDIPLIIVNYNQLTYVRNLANWWRWYSDGDLYVLDNASTYQPLLDYYFQDKELHVQRCLENKAPENLRAFLDSFVHERYPYYVISDADVSPHPATPPNFLEVLKHAITDMGFHHAGFGLISSDLPAWSIDRVNTLRNEASMHTEPVTVTYEGQQYQGFKAPIDTTFAMFTIENGGWYAPMKIEDWTSSLRIFDAFHLPWYLDGDRINVEMDNYFRSAKYRDHGPVSAGKNNYRPKQYQHNIGTPPRPMPGRAAAAAVLRRLRSTRS
jgi:hypothetical protein